MNETYSLVRVREWTWIAQLVNVWALVRREWWLSVTGSCVQGRALKRWGGFKGNAAVHVTNTLVATCQNRGCWVKLLPPLCLSLSKPISILHLLLIPSVSITKSPSPPSWICLFALCEPPPSLFSSLSRLCFIYLFISWKRKSSIWLLTLHLQFTSHFDLLSWGTACSLRLIGFLWPQF